jgi:hypothetical protein
VPQRPCKVPIAPMGNSRFARCLQGGGVAVFGGTVTISSCTISGNTAQNVRAHPLKFPMPQWESLADMFNLTLAFQLGGIHLLFYQGFVRACKTPSCSCSKVPMAPMGDSRFCSLFAGRRCLRLFRHGHDNVFLDLREYRLHCVCSCSKVPNAPMGENC